MTNFFEKLKGLSTRGLEGEDNYQNLLVTHLRLITSTIQIKSF